MKYKYIQLCLLLFFSSMASYAQTNQCGIYKTFDDYENRQLTFSGNCNFGEKAVRLDNFFLKPFIVLS